MLLIFLDTEATGLDPEKHRPIEIAFKIVDTLSNRIIASYESVIVQSREVWAEADPESTKIHGFTYEEILKGKSEKTVEGDITTFLNDANVADLSGAFVCQNPAFDRICFNKIIPAHLQYQYGWPYHWLDLASMYWTWRHIKEGDKANVIKEEGLSKDSIAAYFNIPPEAKPHRAMNGVRHLLSCYRAMFG